MLTEYLANGFLLCWFCNKWASVYYIAALGKNSGILQGQFKPCCLKLANPGIWQSYEPE